MNDEDKLLSPFKRNSELSIVKQVSAIAEMLTTAHEYNLEVEIVWSFGKAMANGNSTMEAIDIAKAEWDVV